MMHEIQTKGYKHTRHQSMTYGADFRFVPQSVMCQDHENC